MPGDVFRSVQRALTRASSTEDPGVNDDSLLPSEKCHLYHLLSYSKEKQTETGVVALDFNDVRMLSQISSERNTFNCRRTGRIEQDLILQWGIDSINLFFALLQDIAIALNSVLSGISGSPSLVGESSKSVRQMTRSLNHVVEVEQDPDSRITILNALTFGGT